MTLEEYLVSLGWKVDNEGMKRFVGAVSMVGARTAELGAAAVETALAVESMVAHVAKGYETLYYMSARTGKSVQYIQGTQYAFKQIGLSAEEANESIEGIAQSLRTQPWLKAIFGNASTPQDVAKYLKNSGLPYFLQVRFAQMIGMGEKTLLQLEQYGDEEEKFRQQLTSMQKAAGFDPQDFANKSKDFGRALTHLEQELTVFGDRMAADLIGPTQKSVTWLTDAVHWLNEVNNATHGWTGTLIGLAGAAAGAITALSVMERVARAAFGLSGKTATGSILSKGAKGLFRGGGWIGASILALETVKNDNPETKKAWREALGPVLYKLGLSKSPDLVGDGSVSGGVSAGGSGKMVSSGSSDVNAAITAAANAAGIDLNTMKAIASIESSMNPSSNMNRPTQYKGLYQIGRNEWNQYGQGDIYNASDNAMAAARMLASHRDEFKKKFGRDPSDIELYMMHQQGLGFYTNGAMTNIGGNPYPGMFGPQTHESFEAGWAKELDRRKGQFSSLPDQLSGSVTQGGGDKSLTINSHATINITGSGDAEGDAKRYTKAHSDVNDNTISASVQAMR